MAQLHKLGFEAEINCNADKFFGMFSHGVTQLPKFLPNIVKSVEVIEGVATSIGSSRLVKYVIGSRSRPAKARLTAFDKEKKSVGYNVVDGEVMNYYEVLTVKLDVVGGAGNGSLVKWSLEFEKVNNDVPSPTAYTQIGHQVAEFSNLLNTMHTTIIKKF
ncbi:hypothetical protein C5167_023060 [Papaver somniferum]|uniref:Bet v I/Major latex protein domain-containing protein n=1 Tax=Papaver somniferum TaxID=3469 RepID=A0A4Y7JNI8_PAPSO|nr:hypothetical protein C5167_023060 [Papaver somniferum]